MEWKWKLCIFSHLGRVEHLEQLLSQNTTSKTWSLISHFGPSKDNSYNLEHKYRTFFSSYFSHLTGPENKVPTIRHRKQSQQNMFVKYMFFSIFLNAESLRYSCIVCIIKFNQCNTIGRGGLQISQIQQQLCPFTGVSSVLNSLSTITNFEF